MKLVLMALMVSFAASNSAFAEDRKVPVKEGYGTLDMSDYNKHSRNQDAKRSKVTVSTSCTDTVGKEHKQGEMGYDSCLINAKNPVDANKTNPQMNVKFGGDGQ
ncbi:hypothetical protein D3C87_1451580 [compost metagenome]